MIEKNYLFNFFTLPIILGSGEDCSKGMTPKEVFDKEHKDLLKVGEEAMRETANLCMLVATLISTVVFAAPLCCDPVE